MIEADATLREALCDALRSRGRLAVGVASAAEGREQLEVSAFDAVVLGPAAATPDPGFETEIVSLAGGGPSERVHDLVSRALEHGRLRRENLHLRARLSRHDDAPPLLSGDPRVEDLLATLTRVAPSELSVILEGEAGTGKSVLAAALHRISPRAGAPFVSVDCRSPRLASALFGDGTGPGLLEVAGPGVLFLRHVEAAATDAQTALLHALETREFRSIGGGRPLRADARIVSATDRSLKRAAQSGAFREDLYYRLNGVTLRVPPLRDRPGDAALLAGHILGESGRGKALSPGAIDALAAYSWPGNVRELRIVIERAALLSNTDRIEAVDLRLDAPEGGLGAAGLPLGLTLAQMEQAYIQTVLAKNGGRRGRAARALGIDPKTLYNKLGPLRRRRRPSRRAATRLTT